MKDKILSKLIKDLCKNNQRQIRIINKEGMMKEIRIVHEYTEMYMNNDVRMMSLWWRENKRESWKLYGVKVGEDIYDTMYSYWIAEFLENEFNMTNKRAVNSYYWSDEWDGYEDRRCIVSFRDGIKLEEWCYDLNSEDNTDVVELWRKVGIDLEIIDKEDDYEDEEDVE